MSVLIKGMEMPKHGDVLVVREYNGKTYIKHEGHLGFEARLIEIPTPHGELVDRNGLMDIYADRLTAVAERYSPDSSECGILSGAMKLLAIQPTVIEAEE